MSRSIAARKFIDLPTPEPHQQATYDRRAAGVLIKKQKIRRGHLAVADLGVAASVGDEHLVFFWNAFDACRRRTPRDREGWASEKRVSGETRLYIGPLGCPSESAL